MGWRWGYCFGVIGLLAACSPAAAPGRMETTAPLSTAPASATPPATLVAATTGSGPTAPLERIKVSFAADAAIYAPFFIAIDKGYLAEEGLEMEIIKAGGGTATPALISGDLQYSTSASASVSAILRGAPLKIIFTNADRPMDELWSTSPDIKTLADLQGKSVGVISRGDSMELETKIVLMQNGIDPNALSFTGSGSGASGSPRCRWAPWQPRCWTPPTWSSLRIRWCEAPTREPARRSPDAVHRSSDQR